MSLAYVIVDVFADTPLLGSRLAVFEDGSALGGACRHGHHCIPCRA